MKGFFKWLGIPFLIAFTLVSAKAAGVTDLLDLCTGKNQSNCPFKVDANGNLTAVGSITATGAISTTGNSTVTGNVSVTGSQTTAGITVFTPTSVTAISSFTTITPSATYLLVTSTGGVVSCGLNALPVVAPCIATATATSGQYLVIGSTQAQMTVVFTSGTASGMDLGAATRGVGAGKVLTVIYNAATSMWDEVSYGNN